MWKSDKFFRPEYRHGRTNLGLYIDGFHPEETPMERKHYQVGVPEGRYTLSIYDEAGKEFGMEFCGDQVLEIVLTECVAVWIGEYVYDGRTPTKAMYFLLIVPDEDKPEKWRRVGLGITKDDLDLQAFFTATLDCYDFNEFILV